MTTPQQTTQPMNRRQFTTGLAAASLTAASAKRVLGANDRINVGVIGCGGRSYAHMNALLNLKENGEKIEFVMVCDTYRPRMEKAMKHTGAKKGTMDHKEITSREDIDLVVISTPDHAHGYQAIDAMHGGKDVYCEKPITHWRQLGLPQRMARVAKETGQILQPGTQYLSNPAYHKAKELIDAGKIGQPVAAECGYYRVGDWGERGMPIDDPNAKPGPDLDWEAFLGDCPRREFDVSRYFRWRMYWDYAGGPSTDLYVHVLAPVSYMMGLGYPDKVVSTGGKHRYQEREVPDSCYILAEYNRNVTVSILGTQGNNYACEGSALRPILRGWDGTITFEENEVVLRPTDGSSVEEERHEVDFGIPFQQFWTDFLECTRTRKQPISNIELGAPVQTVMQMANYAIRGDQVVHFDHESGEVRS